MVHLTAECAPFARTGGLGEAVRTLATAQLAAGTPTAVVMPYYGVIRDAGIERESAILPFAVQVGGREEWVRILRAPPRAGEPSTYFVDHPTFSQRAG